MTLELAHINTLSYQMATVSICFKRIIRSTLRMLDAYAYVNEIIKILLATNGLFCLLLQIKQVAYDNP